MERQSLFLPTVTDWIQDSLISLLSAGLLLMLPVAGARGELYVSPDGNDANPGTRTQPLRTLQGARDRVRNMDKNGPQDVLVLFKAGDYFIDNTVRFGREDSGSSGSRVIYKNWGEKGSAHFIGGRALTAWKGEGEGIYSTQLGRNVYALYENDQPAVMAREPDEGYHEFESVIDFSHLKFREADYGRFDYQGAAVRLWAHWIPGKIAIQNIDFDNRVITLDQPYAGNLKGTVWNDDWAARTRTRFYIYNAKSFLDQPGEFYMDHTSQKLYYRPRRAPIDKQAIVGAKLPNDAAEDSFNMLPVLLGTQRNRRVRPFLLQQAWTLEMSIRKGDWKLLDHKGSGGSNYERNGEWGLKQYAIADTDPDAPGQLYNLASDPGETINVYSKHPEIVAELKTLLEEAKTSGRTAPNR
jgi:hypothetical protein